jgi:hypothetical protein
VAVLEGGRVVQRGERAAIEAAPDSAFGRRFFSRV